MKTCSDIDVGHANSQLVAGVMTSSSDSLAPGPGSLSYSPQVGQLAMPSLKLLLRKMVPVKRCLPNEIIAYACFQGSVKIKREKAALTLWCLCSSPSSARINLGCVLRAWWGREAGWREGVQPMPEPYSQGPVERSQGALGRRVFLCCLNWLPLLHLCHSVGREACERVKTQTSPGVRTHLSIHLFTCLGTDICELLLHARLDGEPRFQAWEAP